MDSRKIFNNVTVTKIESSMYTLDINVKINSFKESVYLLTEKNVDYEVINCKKLSEQSNYTLRISSDRPIYLLITKAYFEKGKYRDVNTKSVILNIYKKLEVRKENPFTNLQGIVYWDLKRVFIFTQDCLSLIELDVS